jgi:hypothetical protein
MQPPYTGLKIVHDQQMQETLERHRHFAGQTVHRQGWVQAFGKALSRFMGQSTKKEDRPLSGCVSIEALLSASLEEMQTVGASSSAPFRECDAACR